MNPTNEWVHLRQNEPVARVEKLSQCDIMNTDDNLEHKHENEMNVQCDKSDAEYIEIARSTGIDLTNSDLTEEQKHKLLVFLGKNRDVFVTCTAELGHTKLFPHTIDTGDAPPVRKRPYRMTPEQKKEIERQTEDMEKHGNISPSCTPWQSPIVLVKKSSGEYRFAVDYRAVNKVTKPLHFPITHFQDVIDALGQKDEQGREHVLSYGGRSLRPAEKNWGISDLEGLALVEDTECPDVMEYTLEYTEPKVVDINSVTTKCDKNRLSEMINAVDAYNDINPTEFMKEISNLTVEQLRIDQMADEDFVPLLEYKKNGKVPDDREAARRLVAEA
ncbi:uncharacterized protein LOC128550999 [Mercenaria mercenaria]|uniref:uncharacterized protein LOC128550999 n=1 Tax=Mercenaria mercenaria TaxID=6596 RepID=UPI00234E67FD|nr:uncharacterized protein LOC128550999 [Mercenaria mercenaria]